MDLLSNAIESIRAGVEDYEQGSHGRLLAAVRNIHAGILLLYKLFIVSRLFESLFGLPLTSFHSLLP